MKFPRIFAALATLAAGLLAGPAAPRARTCDVAFGYRMGSGFPGDVNRTHPASILARLLNTTVQAPRAHGDPVFINAADSSVRGIVAGDGSTTPGRIYGVLVRPYPTQQMSGGPSAAIGASAPPTGGVGDVLRSGFIMAKLPAGASVVADGTVYVWAAATSGNNIQGKLVAAANGTNTYTVTNARFVGPADADGNVEIEVWAA